VRELAAEILQRYPRLEVLVNNAGVINTSRRFSEDGIELTWAVNHLAPFLLTTLLLDRLAESAPSRIVTTASDAHRVAKNGIPFENLRGDHAWPKRGFGRYGETKLANILFTAELARRLGATGVTANCFHPGFVATGLGKNNGVAGRMLVPLLKPFARSPRKGAETLVWLVDSPEVAGESGGYYFDEKRANPSAWAQDTGAAERLWEISEEQTRATAGR
jgi:NAD(P)-dependent dehydrogenase (short-subunit alcohol dehydrogenase family)